MSISFFRITPTELQLIDNTASSSSSSSGRGDSGVFGAEFHRERAYSVVTGLPTLAADRITASLQSLEVPAGENIVKQGNPADKFFIVVEGEAEVVREEDGKERQIASLSAGQLYGEVAIMRDQPRSATVRAKTDTRLLALERDDFRDLIAQSMELTPDFAELIRARLDSHDRG
jgi:CRP-like cAMP-binding protein